MDVDRLYVTAIITAGGPALYVVVTAPGCPVGPPPPVYAVPQEPLGTTWTRRRCLDRRWRCGKTVDG